jgi:hypothetical protein
MPNIHVRELRSLAGRMDGTVRRATLNGREHVVVPIVAMIGDAVIRPMNSRGPEYIPADVLSSICASWNGRDVVMAPDVGHPTLNGSPISANSPDVADRHCYGRVYNARYEDNRFRADMWLDPIRAAAVGPHAVDVIDRALAGLPVEVSIGATAYERAEPGTSPSGVAYDYRWVHAESDHLATLPRGLAGACSVEMGCGGPRYLSNGKESPMPDLTIPVNVNVELTGGVPLLSRLFRGAADLGPSSNAVYNSLCRVLRATVPAFEWVVDIYPDTSTVIYSVSPDEYSTYQRTYTVDGNGEVTLNDDAVEVEGQMVWAPVAASADGLRAATKKMTPFRRLLRLIRDVAVLHKELPDEPDDAGATTNTDTNTDAAATATPVAATAADNHVDSADGGTARQKENCMCQSAKDLAGRLIAKGGPFSEDQRPTLEALGEATLRALVEQNPNPSPKTPDQPTVPTPENPPTPSPGPKSVAATLASLTEADILSHFPSLASAVNENNARNAEIRASLVAALRDNTNGAYTPEELAALPIPALRQLTKALSLDQPKIDYGIVGLASPPYTVTAERDIPDAWGIDKVKPS